MKRFLYLVAFGILVFFFPGKISAEEIQWFRNDIDIKKDGTIQVVEAIRYDFGSQERHGIYRKIPYVKTNQDGKRYQLKYTDISVADEDGTPYRVSQTREDGYMTLKIGDPNRTITGTHTYVISYMVAGALTYFSEHDELYWNATGNEWEVPIEQAAVTVRLPEEVPAKDLQIACYTGVQGSTRQDCNIDVGKAVSATSTYRLGSAEGLTVVVGFPRGMVAVLEPEPYVTFWETPFGVIVTGMGIAAGVMLAIAWYALYPAWLIYKWYNVGRDPRPPMGVTSAWYDAPKTKSLRTLTPGETGTLVDEQADLRDIFATIVDLARRGYMKIIENKKNDYSLMKLTGIQDGDRLVDHEETLIEGLFRSGDVLKLKGADLISEMEKVKSSLYESLVQEDFFPENPKKIRDFYSVVAGLALFTINLPLFLVAVVFGYSMPRKTMRGAQGTAVAKSLKNFLVSQEEKLEFQARNQMFFEKLLPYAVAFGVENVWAKRFADIAMKKPEWYVSSSHSGFYPTSFVRSLDASFAGVTRAATPTRSSSGFSSGFSGGSSGGGGGGGGGGSW